MSKQNDNDDVVGDDLGPFDDLVRALQAPGSADELADEQHFLAAYREIHAPVAPVISLPRRLATRMGAGGTALIVAVAVSGGGVAAALTGNLPDPVQEFAHSVLGAPAPEQRSPEISPAPAVIEPSEESAPAEPSSEASPTTPPGESSEPDESRPNKRDRNSPSPTPEPSTPTDAAVAPSPSVTPAEPSPEPTQPAKPPASPKAPASLAMSAASHRVTYGGSITLAGRVTDLGGRPVVGRKVVLQVRGPSGWRPATRLRSDSDGVISAQTAAVFGLSRYRWRVGQSLRSPVWRVRVQATLSSSYAVDGEQTTVTATSSGGQPGDLINLYVVVKKVPTFVAAARVRDDGIAEFTVPTPPRRRVLVLRLERTLDHTAAKTRLTVFPPA